MVRSAKPPLRRRPALVYDEETLGKLAALGAIQATEPEAALWLGVTERRLRNFFKEHPLARLEFEQAAAKARVALRTAQFKLAEKSPTMAVFLGKHYLGQAERRELDTSAQVAEAAEDAQFVRNALAALAAGRGGQGVCEGGGGRAGQ
jgi:hypothetical protein